MKKNGPLIDFLIRKGVARDIFSANIILILIIFVNLALTYYTSEKFIRLTGFTTTDSENIPTSLQRSLPQPAINPYTTK